MIIYLFILFIISASAYGMEAERGNKVPSNAVPSLQDLCIERIHQLLVQGELTQKDLPILDTNRKKDIKKKRSEKWDSVIKKLNRDTFAHYTKKVNCYCVINSNGTISLWKRGKWSSKFLKDMSWRETIHYVTTYKKIPEYKESEITGDQKYLALFLLQNQEKKALSKKQINTLKTIPYEPLRGYLIHMAYSQKKTASSHS